MTNTIDEYDDEWYASTTLVCRSQVPAPRIFFDGTYLPSDAGSVSSASSTRSLLPASRSKLAVVVMCGAAVVVMLGSSGQMISQEFRTAKVRQLRTGIAKAIAPPSEDEDTTTTASEDEEEFRNSDGLINNGGNFLLDVFLSVLVDEDVSQLLLEGTDSVGDSNVEIVFEEQETVNATIATTLSGSDMHAVQLNSTQYKSSGKIDVTEGEINIVDIEPSSGESGRQRGAATADVENNPTIIHAD